MTIVRDFFDVTTSIGDAVTAVIGRCSRESHRPKVPRMAERLPADIVQLPFVAIQKNPHSLPDKSVLVVGTGYRLSDCRRSR
jgi:putative flavoprotein involved in K+ transport